jgi:ATP-dependent exoDNAse (exonuclease V) beta subunit
MTRARERLIVLAAPSRATARWVEALGAWGYRVDAPPADGAPLADGEVLHRRPPVPVSRRRTETAEIAGEPAAVAAWQSARDALAAEGPPLRAPSAEESWRAEDDEHGAGAAVRRFASRESARVVGVVAHRALERWDGRDPDALLSRAAALSRAEAAAAGADAHEVEHEVRRVLEGFLDSELANRLAGVEILGREVPLVERAEAGPVYRGTLDLLYRDADGTHVVADYKTDLETDARALFATYRPQLEIYARTVQRSLRLLFPPRAELWMLRTGTRIVLDD